MKLSIERRNVAARPLSELTNPKSSIEHRHIFGNKAHKGSCVIKEWRVRKACIKDMQESIIQNAIVCVSMILKV